MITEPRLDESGDPVTHCGALTSSKDQRDATLIHRLPSTATIGPILSIRAFDFESVCGFDLFLTFEKKNKPCGSLLDWAKSLSAEETTIDKLLSVSSSSAQSIPTIPRTKKDTRYAATVTTLKSPMQYGEKSLSKTARGPVRTSGASGVFRSPQFCQTSHCRSSKKAMRQNSTISGLRRTRQQSNKEGSKATQDGHALFSALVNPHGQDPLTKKYGLSHMRWRDPHAKDKASVVGTRGANDSKPKGDHHVFTRTDFEHFCAFFGTRVFLHFDCALLCCVFFRRSNGGHAPPFE